MYYEVLGMQLSLIQHKVFCKEADQKWSDLDEAVANNIKVYN